MTPVKPFSSLDTMLQTKIDMSPLLDSDTSFQETEESADHNDIPSDDDEVPRLGEKLPREFPLLRRNTRIKPPQSHAQSSSSVSSKTSERSAANSLAFSRRVSRIGSAVPSLPESGYESDDDNESNLETYHGFVPTTLRILDQYARDGFGGTKGPLAILAVRNGVVEASSEDERPRLANITNLDGSTESTTFSSNSNLSTVNPPRRRLSIPHATTFSQGVAELSNIIVRSHQSGENPDSTATATRRASDHFNHRTRRTHISFQDDFEERQAQRKRKYCSIFNEGSHSSEGSPVLKVPRASLQQDTSDSSRNPIIGFHSIIQTALLEDPRGTHLIPDVARKIYEAGYNTFADFKRSSDDSSGLHEPGVDIELGEMSTLTRSARLLQASKVQTWRHRVTKLMEDVIAASPGKGWVTERFFPSKREMRGGLPSFDPLDAIKNFSVDQENQASKVRDMTREPAHVREEAERGSPPAYMEHSLLRTSATNERVEDRVRVRIRQERAEFIAAMLPLFCSNSIM